MICPYCYTDSCVPDVVYLNIENYGSNQVKFKCRYCSKVIKTYGERKVIFGKLQKTDGNSDWG